MKIARNIGLGVIGLFALGAATIWAASGPIGFADLLRHGGFYWLPAALDSPRLSPAMRLALARDPVATPGIVSWKTLADGFEAGELPVMVDGQAVDTILLARIDPAKFRFVARTAPDGSRGLDEWMAALHPALVVNGSYSALDGRPDTPFKNDGALMGPSVYDAKAGAFVASDGFTGIRNLAGEDWKTAFAEARDAMVSFPLLVRDGASGVKTPSRWLANRSFVGQDADGKIIIGTTRDAFFSLARLADFLIASPLRLTLALNLDGGPVASQAISLGGFERRSYGSLELQVKDNSGSLLFMPYGTAEMPVVLAVLPR